MIQLVGPGGAGKSTAGRMLADRLRLPFMDLDEQFMSAVGHIGGFIDSRGYPAYAARNVRLYLEVVGEAGGTAILALSSGFMTYPSDIDPLYEATRAQIASGAGTFVLLPSLDLETCVAETVRRQLARPYIARSSAQEEAVIRERFWIYFSLSATKVETMRPVAAVVDELASCVAAQLGDEAVRGAVAGDAKSGDR